MSKRTYAEAVAELGEKRAKRTELAADIDKVRNEFMSAFHALKIVSADDTDYELDYRVYTSLENAIAARSQLLASHRDCLGLIIKLTGYKTDKLLEAVDEDVDDYSPLKEIGIVNLVQCGLDGDIDHNMIYVALKDMDESYALVSRLISDQPMYSVSVHKSVVDGYPNEIMTIDQVADKIKEILFD